MVIRRKGKRRFPGREDKKYLAWIREQPCIVCGNPETVPHHAPSKAQGGYDKGGTVPICGRDHFIHHASGETWGLDFALEAQMMLTQYPQA